MRQYLCECLKCKTKNNLQFSAEPYPKFEDQFDALCKVCGTKTPHRRVLTRKTRSELHRRQGENDLRKSIADECAKHEFKYRFVGESVVITTPLADWCFDYHQSRITLYHESTIKINFETGNYCKAHCQFRNRKTKPIEVIEYIAAHEKWKEEQKNNG